MMPLLSLASVSKLVGSGSLFENVGFSIETGERVGLVGPNGSGKSTLLRLLAGSVEPDDGTIARARGLHVSALDQRPTVTPGLAVADYLSAANPEAAQRARVACTQLGLTDLALPLEALSGGMLRKAALARCLAVDADLLLLDEPTNHLDLDAVLWLEARLAASRCGFVLVTHDRLTDTLFVFDGECGIRPFVGSYDAYRAQTDRSSAAVDMTIGGRAARPARGADGDSGADGTSTPVRDPRHGLSFRERREYEGLPDEIALAEEELTRLEAHFGAATHDPAELAERTRRYHALRDEVERKTARWEELAERAEK